jgi:hypothetical protein
LLPHGFLMNCNGEALSLAVGGPSARVFLVGAEKAARRSMHNDLSMLNLSLEILLFRAWRALRRVFCREGARGSLGHPGFGAAATLGALVCEYHRPSWNGSTKTAMHSKFCPEQEV